MTERKIEAIDTPVDATGWIPEEDAVLDLTEGRIVAEREAEFERAYRDFVAQLEAGKPSPAVGKGSVDTSAEDDEEAAYRRFVEQSGMADFTGTGSEDPQGGADMSEAADRGGPPKTGNFFGASEFLWMAAEEAAAGDADLSEDGGRGDEALPREVREAEELNDALLRQAQAEHFGPDESGGAGDEEMWAEYRRVVGEDR